MKRCRVCTDDGWYHRSLDGEELVNVVVGQGAHERSIQTRGQGAGVTHGSVDLNCLREPGGESQATSLAASSLDVHRHQWNGIKTNEKAARFGGIMGGRGFSTSASSASPLVRVPSSTSFIHSYQHIMACDCTDLCRRFHGCCSLLVSPLPAAVVEARLCTVCCCNISMSARTGFLSFGNGIEETRVSSRRVLGLSLARVARNGEHVRV